ncbi:peptidoglycan bridge formation glycyltransferase FemA/FemB family protein [Candidatus Saccharibacteria bacterium]|nr:peptidoglycan bridge formation glycyltransferase FemA/FemB family protein [Candidatus Saccharibacteria bacterium]
MDQVPKNWDKSQSQQCASFLQSSWWAAFQSEVGAKPHFLSGDGWSCLLLEKRNRLGKYLLAQYGPTVDSAQALDVCLSHLMDQGRQLGANWLSLEPVSHKSSVDEIQDIMRRHKAQPAARHREPDLTRLVDLSPSDENLLASISQSTRSFIRKNQRENILGFKTSFDPQEIIIFIKMLNLVAGRNRVNFFSDSYFKKQAELLMPVKAMHLEFALEDKKPVAAAIFHDYGHTCTYTYAASLPEARKTSASALLLWQAMLNAKNRGIKKMDLYGIAPDGAPADHPWAGFTSFKAKFGGEVVRLPGTWDIALSPKYNLYRTAHQVRKIIKRH